MRDVGTASRRPRPCGRGGFRSIPGPAIPNEKRTEPMADSFPALVLSEQDGKVSHEIKQLSAADLPAGDVTVRVEYSDVKYKDGMVVNGLGKPDRQCIGMGDSS